VPSLRCCFDYRTRAFVLLQDGVTGRQHESVERKNALFWSDAAVSMNGLQK
jgi:hypothetical protein